MNNPSLSQLDEQLRQLKNEDMLALNRLSERYKIEQQARRDGWWLLITGIIAFVLGILRLEQGITAYAQIVLGVWVTVLAIAALRRVSAVTLVWMALAMLLSAVYNIVLLSIIFGQLSLPGLFFGLAQCFLANHYWRTAQHLHAIENDVLETEHIALYESVYSTLTNMPPNASNNLIELHYHNSRIAIWLRKNNPVIAIEREKRLFFDMTHALSIEIAGEDRGGEYVNVQAIIADEKLPCTISRYSWLRYKQYSRY